MQREDQRGIIGDAQFCRGHLDALRRQAVNLVAEGCGVDHDTIANHRELAAPHDARGQQAELVGHPVDHQRMAGIVPALIPHHDVGLL